MELRCALAKQIAQRPDIEPENDQRSIENFLRLVECCRRDGMFDDANRILTMIEAVPFSQYSPIAERIADQKNRIAIGDTSEVVVVEQPNAEPQPEPPPLWVRGINLATALFRWTAAGFPTRSADEIEERLAICQACPLFRDGVCTHQLCGCNVGDPEQLLNKLSLRTEKCPEGRWT